MTGFFPTETKVRPLPVLPQCGECGLYKTCKTKKMKVAGEGRKRIMVVGEAPGQVEDEKGRPFVGKSGQFLRRALGRVGVDLDKDCWATNAVICWPPGNKVGNENRIDNCRPNLFAAVQEYKPRVIILVGGSPIKSLFGRLFKPDPGGVFKWAGWKVPWREQDAWACPTFHPSYLLREENPLLDRLFDSHLEAAVGIDKPARPPDGWKPYRDRVQVFMNPRDAADMIDGVRTLGLPAAFDYETNMLKPDSDRAFIACAGVSNGDANFAFPFVGEAVEAFKAFLKSDVPKVGYNVKFEDRWSRTVLGVRPRNWVWDGMVQAHVLDNRPGICGLKFQAFARLGQGDYNSAVSPYLKSSGKGGYAENRVKEANPRELLTYCGMDALLELLVYRHQKREMEAKA